MSKIKLDIDDKIIAYKFINFEGLIFHSNKFWMNEKPCRVVYNNGSKSVLVGNRKLVIMKLRKNAIKIQIESIKLPF
jgi:hypothetical protein